MRAMILAAGVGSRLAPITDALPKPLIPVLGKPVLSRIIELLQANGFKEFIANTHYLGDKIQAAYSDQITIRHEENLSGVAGGIRVCADFLREANDTVAIIMGDALTNIDLEAMLKAHKASGAQASMAIKEVEDTTQFGVVCFDKNNKVTSFQEKPKPSEALSNWANTGVYLFEPSVLDEIPSVEDAPQYDVAKDLFPAMLAKGIHMNVFKTDSYWADLGTHAQYRQTLKDCITGIFKIEIPGDKYSWGYLSDSAQLSPGCFIKGKAYIGANSKVGRSIFKGTVVIEENCVIEDDVVLEDCLVLSGSVIKSGCKLKAQNIKPGDVVEPPAEEGLKIIPVDTKKQKDETLLSIVKEASENLINIFKN